MTYYIKRAVKFFDAEPFTVVVNDYSCREVAERALKAFQQRKPLPGVESIKFFIDTEY